MNPDLLCMGCMSEKGSNEVCPVCGWKDGTNQESAVYLPPHTILNGRYLLGRVLGYGGFGITYLAWDLKLQIKLAVKEYFPQNLATRTPGNISISIYTSGDAREHFNYGSEKFIDEARALAQFNNHPCIVSVLDFFKENNTAYLVMEYIEGVNLKEYLDNKGGKLPVKMALEIMMPAMDALREVHNTGMLHRDISPENIYITKGKQVKLLDFGAARFAMGEHSKSLSIVLRPGYSPEEQYRSKGKQGPWTDIYAVAASIYRMITGEVPPDALDRKEEDTIKPPSTLGIEISLAVEEALLKAIAIKAADRFQTIGEFQQVLLPEITKQEETIKQDLASYLICPWCGRKNLVKDDQSSDILCCENCSEKINPGVIQAAATRQADLTPLKMNSRELLKYLLPVSGLLALIFIIIISIVNTNWKSKYERLSERYQQASANEGWKLKYQNLNNQYQEASDKAKKFDEIKNNLAQLDDKDLIIATEIKLRNQSNNQNALGEYTTNFKASDIRYICFYVTIKNLAAGIKDIKGKLAVKYYTPNGNLIRISENENYSLLEDCNVSDETIITRGLGSAEGRSTINSSTGRYRIEFWFKDKMIGQTSFNVYE
jgi:serine/threonine protein kinase